MAFLLFDDNCLRNMHAELVTCNLGQRVGIKIYSPLLVKFSILSSFSLWVFSRCVPLRVSMHHQRWNSKKTPSEREGERMPCNMSCANTIAINCRIHNNTLSTYNQLDASRIITSSNLFCSRNVCYSVCNSVTHKHGNNGQFSWAVL